MRKIISKKTAAQSGGDRKTMLIGAELHKKVKLLALQRDMTITGLVTEAIEMWVQKNKIKI